jgi:hypothetical protein
MEPMARMGQRGVARTRLVGGHLRWQIFTRDENDTSPIIGLSGTRPDEALQHTTCFTVKISSNHWEWMRVAQVATVSYHALLRGGTRILLDVSRAVNDWEASGRVIIIFRMYVRKTSHEWT